MSEQIITERDSTGWETLPDTWADCIRRVMAGRGITAKSDLYFELSALPPPSALLGMADAAAVISAAIRNQQRIMIVADFDADGATSCAVAIRGLHAMGAAAVDYIVPCRQRHGYGLSPALLADIPTENQPDLLITVDNGIASIDGVAAANARGMQVVVTDHHLAGDSLPDAAAIVDPNQPEDTFPSNCLAGVGVCFYVLLGVRAALRAQAWFSEQRPEPNLSDLLPFVALGTVADMVPLDKINRTLVQRGLAQIRHGRAPAGITALAAVAGRQLATLSTQDIGFALAPRINAAGRLDDMAIGIACLLTDDATTAQDYATLLDDLNQQRRAVEQDMQTAAQSAVAQLDLSADNDAPPLGYCLFDADWHIGVVGLLASRIKAKQHRPVVAFAQGDDGELKGSSRSISGVHIRDVLADIASQQPDLITRFGGHAMAAGLTLPAANLVQFEAAFLMTLARYITPDLLTENIQTDGELLPHEFSLSIADQLARIAPWGQRFDAPLFKGEFEVLSWQEIGKNADHLRLSLAPIAEHEPLAAIAFGHTRPLWLTAGTTISICYRLEINEFRNTRRLQLMIVSLKQAND